MKRFVVLVVLFCSLAHGQESIKPHSVALDSNSWTPRKTIAAATLGGILVATMVNGYYEWWKDASEPFHFENDGFFNNYSLGVDKVGHAFTAYAYFHLVHSVLLWGDFSPNAAFWWGVGVSSGLAVAIEIGDGFSPLGFSFPDLLFNSLGLGYGVLQVKVPFLQNFNFKWSYIPPDGWKFPPRFTNHYDGHTYWMTVNLHNLLPRGAQSWWPEFLQLAVGYGCADGYTRRKAAIGLDFNLRSFSVENRELRLLQQNIDMIHFPAPAVRFVEGYPPEFKLFYTY